MIAFNHAHYKRQKGIFVKSLMKVKEFGKLQTM